MKERKTMKRLFFVLLIALTAIPCITAESVRSWNHDSNPALLGVRNRGIIESGYSLDFGFANSYVTPGQIFQKEIVIDFNEISNDLAGGNFLIGSTFDYASHLALTVAGVNIAGYMGVDGIFSGGIPGDFFQLIANGNELNKTYEGSSPVIARIFAETGVVAGYRLGNLQLAMKIGAYAPLVYSYDSTFSYSIATYDVPQQIDTDGDGVPEEVYAKAESTVSMPFYTALDIEGIANGSLTGSFTVNELLNQLNGLKADLGVVMMKDKKAVAGVNVGGIPIRPATARYGVDFNMKSGAYMYNLMSSLETDVSNAFSAPEPEMSPLEPVETSVQIKMPLKVGAFYRLTGIPSFIDWVFHSQFYIDDPFMYTAGIHAEGSFFPLSILSAGIEYDRISWKATGGLRLNLYILESGIDLSFSSPDILSLYSAEGFAMKIYGAIGF